jgi:hypothetical protein
MLKVINKFLQAGTGYSDTTSNGTVEMKTLNMRYNTQRIFGLIATLNHTHDPST